MINYEHWLSYTHDRGNKQIFIEVNESGFHTITNSNIHNEQFTLEESICSETELRFGGCEASKIQFKTNNIMSSLKDKLLTVKQVVDGHSDNPLQLGVFRVFSDKLTADRKHREIIAYDRMYDIVNTDITDWYNGIVFPIQINKLRNLLFEYLEISHQDTVLINDEAIVDKAVFGSKVSAGDLLKDICELNACFGKMSREDIFTYVTLFNASVETKTKSDYSDVQYEDFSTKPIERILITQGSIDTDYYYGEGKNTYTISPRVLQIKDNNLKSISENIYENIKWITYIPTSIECRGNPCIECGDMITFVSGDNVETQTFVFERKLTGIRSLRDSYMSNGTEYYLDIDSSNNNVISSINNGLSEVYKNSLYCITLTNSELFNIKNSEQNVLRYDIAVTADTEVVVSLTVPFLAELDGVIKLNYYVDAELMDNQTIRHYFQRGQNVLSACNFITLKKNDRVTLTIALKSEYFESDKRISDAKIISLENYVKNGSYNPVDIDTTIPNVRIEKEAIRSFIIAKGLVIAEGGWDGTINLSDAFGTFELDNIGVVGFDDEVSINKLYPIPVGSISQPFGYINTNDISIDGISDNLIINEVVYNYAFNTENASMYDYNNEYVTDNSAFALKTSYEYTSVSEEIDSGKMCKVTIRTDDKASIESVVIK